MIPYFPAPKIIPSPRLHIAAPREYAASRYRLSIASLEEPKTQTVLKSTSP